MTEAIKPLGRKSYHSIPHLIGSKAGSGDHFCDIGQNNICTVSTRDKNDLIIVQEKYDGSNVAIANIDGNIVALTRSGYAAKDSPYYQHEVFDKWVNQERKRFESILSPGDMICGEWMFQAHGLKYKIYGEPFVAFDLFRSGKRLTAKNLNRICNEFGIETPRLVHFGGAISTNDAMGWLVGNGFIPNINCLEKPEGIVYRVERKEDVRFLTKYVRPDFIPGKYLPDISGGEAIYNINESEFLK